MFVAWVSRFPEKSRSPYLEVGELNGRAGWI